jgi:hypothetical protein
VNLFYGSFYFTAKELWQAFFFAEVEFLSRALESFIIFILFP